MSDLHPNVRDQPRAGLTGFLHALQGSMGFLVESVFAITAFLGFYLAALILGSIVAWLNSRFHTEPWLESAGQLVEKVLVGADIALLVLYLAQHVAKRAIALSFEVWADILLARGPARFESDHDG